jgi:membrane protease YdiL (CAAX protease family)
VTGAPDTTQAESVAAVAFSPLAAVGLVLTAAVIVPVVEEVSFRAVLFGWLRWRWGRLVAYPLSAVVFAALHGIPAIVPAIAVFGLVLAYLYDASRSLWPGIAVHAAFNAINTIGLLIVLR